MTTFPQQGWERAPEEWLVRDPTLQRPGPLQSDWVRRGIPRGGNVFKRATLGGVEPEPVGPGDAAEGWGSHGVPATSSSASPPKSMARTASAPANVNLPRVSPNGGQAVGLSRPGGSGKSPGKGARAMKMLVGGGGPAGGGAQKTGEGGAPSPSVKSTARSAASAASTAVPAGSAGAASAPDTSRPSSPAKTPSRAVLALNRLKAKAEAAAKAGNKNTANAAASGKGLGKGGLSASAPADVTQKPGESPTKGSWPGGKGEAQAAGEPAPATPKTPKTPLKPVSEKVWVALEGPSGETTKIRVKARLSTNDLRKAVCAKTAVPLKDLELKVGDKILDQARAAAFKGMSHEQIQKTTVYWWRQDRLQILMDKRKLADHNSRGWLGRTVLHYCVLDGDFTLCLEICNKDWSPDVMNVQDTLGDTALMFASICGFDDIVELLLDRQAEPDHMNLCGRNALMLAAEHGHHKTEKALLTGCARRGPNIGFRHPDEVYLAELNEHDKVLSSIRVFELAEAAVADLADLGV